MGYDPVQLLATIDGHKWWILGGFGVAMVFQWWWLLECVRVAKCERVYSMPLFCTFFWFGLLTAAVLEVVFFAQVVKYGRDELAPGISTRTFVAGLVIVQVFATVGWEFVKSVLDDPLYQLSTPLTIIAYPLFGFALLIRRRSTIGQTVTMWVTFVCMAALWFVTTALWFGDPFRAWQQLIVGALSVAGGLAMAYLVSDRSAWFGREAAQGSRRLLRLAQADAVQDEGGHLGEQLLLVRRVRSTREQV